jgi:hypothetical protein
MALRRFVFQTLAAGSGYFDSSQDSDELQVAKVTIVTGVAGVGLAMGTTDITGVRDILLAREMTFSGGVGGIAIDAGGLRITNLNLTPSANSDAVSKQYVDNLASGVDWKNSVRVALTTNLPNPTTAPGASIDGVTMAANDRFLLTGQTTASENGIYVWTNATTAARSADGSAGMLTSGAAVFVAEGNQDNKAFILTTNDPITVGSTAQSWSQFVGVGTYTASNGVSISTNAISGVANTAAGIGVDASGFKVVLNGTNPGLAFTSTYVDVKYGNGVAASAAGVTVTPNTAQGVNVSASGVGVTLNGTNPGLAFTSTYVDVKYNAAGAIIATATGISLNLNATNPGLAITTNALDIKYSNGTAASAAGIVAVGNAAQGINVGASGIGITLMTNPGLQFNTGLGVLINATGASGTAGGLNLAAGGLGISLATTNPGLSVTSGLSVVIDATTTGGLTKNANGLAILLNGTTLSLSPSLGLSVLGVPAAGTWTIGGTATSANVTAANLTTLTGGGDASALHTHAGLSSSAVAFSSTVGTGGVTKGDCLYYSANDTVNKGDPTNLAKSVIYGIATSTQSAAATVQVQTDGVLAGAGSGWTAGQQIFMSTAGGLTNDPTTLASRSRTIQVGIAKNATDLAISVRDLGMKP